MTTNFSIRHFGIVVKDLEDSLFFYENLLGFKVFKKTCILMLYIDIKSRQLF